MQIKCFLSFRSGLRVQKFSLNFEQPATHKTHATGHAKFAYIRRYIYNTLLIYNMWVREKKKQNEKKKAAHSRRTTLRMSFACRFNNLTFYLLKYQNMLAPFLPECVRCGKKWFLNGVRAAEIEVPILNEVFSLLLLSVFCCCCCCCLNRGYCWRRPLQSSNPYIYSDALSDALDHFDRRPADTHSPIYRSFVCLCCCLFFLFHHTLFTHPYWYILYDFDS